MNEKYDIFISYSRKDKAIADKICSACDEAQLSYFIDRTGIHSGQDFVDVIIKAIRRSSIFLFLASENAYKSQITQDEVFEALDYVAQGKCTIVTYIIDGSMLPDSLRFRLRRYNWRDMREHPIKDVLVPDLFTLLGRSPNHVSNNSEELKRQVEEWYNKGEDFYKKEDYEQAVYWYCKAAEQGNAEAQYNLGFCYETGRGVDMDCNKAIGWYSKAAEQGDNEAKIAKDRLGQSKLYEFALSKYKSFGVEALTDNERTLLSSRGWR